MNADLSRLVTDFFENSYQVRQPPGLRPLLVVLGPTASGKTALSLELAKQFNGEIISADSRQVYRGMDIGTDKIPLEKREGVPHHLIDVAEPTERFTVADFKRLAEQKIEEILARGKLPMLVGGTGLYLRAITENFDLPPENPKIKAELERELKEQGLEKMYEKLQQLDPENAATISPKNRVYVLRALEIFLGTGQPKRAQKKPTKWSVLKIGLSWPREVLFERIHQRILYQVQHGLIEETKKLLEAGYSRELASMRSLGYREMSAHLAGELSRQAATELLKQHTRNFAKRQNTWFKKEPDVQWIRCS